MAPLQLGGQKLQRYQRGVRLLVHGPQCRSGATIRVAVTAVNSAGSATAVSTPVLVLPITDSTPPSAPTGLTIAGTTSSSISLAWSPSTDNVGVAGYDLFRNGSKLATVTGTSYTFGGLACGTTYTLAVDAFDGAGNVSARASVARATGPCGGVAFYVSPAGSDSNPGTWPSPGRRSRRR